MVRAAPRHGPFQAAGRDIEATIDRLLADPQQRTADLGGSLGTAAFSRAVAGALGA